MTQEYVAYIVMTILVTYTCRLFEQIGRFESVQVNAEQRGGIAFSTAEEQAEVNSSAHFELRYQHIFTLILKSPMWFFNQVLSE